MIKGDCYICGGKELLNYCVVGNYRLVQCKTCSFVFVYPIPLQEDLNRFYNKFDYKDITYAEKIIRNDAKRSLRKISKYRIPPGDLLDIGCGRGFFMDEARKLGWNTTGIDYSELVIEYAKKRLSLNVYRQDVFKYKTNKKYDVVVLNQIIEHLSNPNELIKVCFNLLRYGGILYIVTPNIDSLLSKIEKENFDHIIPPEHLGYYSKKTLSNLLSFWEFKVLNTASWSYSQDLGGIIKTILREKTGQKQTIEGPVETKVRADTNDRMKFFKHILFDKLFCKIFYRILNIDSFGTNLEIIATKE